MGFGLDGGSGEEYVPTDLEERGRNAERERREIVSEGEEEEELPSLIRKELKEGERYAHTELHLKGKGEEEDEEKGEVSIEAEGGRGQRRKKERRSLPKSSESDKKTNTNRLDQHIPTLQCYKSSHNQPGSCWWP